VIARTAKQGLRNLKRRLKRPRIRSTMIFSRRSRKSTPCKPSKTSLMSSKSRSLSKAQRIKELAKERRYAHR